MKKRTVTKRETVVLSGFGAALALMAGGVAAAEQSLQPHILKPTANVMHAAPIVQKDILCGLRDESCMTSKSFAQKLNMSQLRQLKVLIAKGMQVDLKDNCLIC